MVLSLDWRSMIVYESPGHCPGAGLRAAKKLMVFSGYSHSLADGNRASPGSSTWEVSRKNSVNATMDFHTSLQWLNAEVSPKLNSPTCWMVFALIFLVGGGGIVTHCDSYPFLDALRQVMSALRCSQCTATRSGRPCGSVSSFDGHVERILTS